MTLLDFYEQDLVAAQGAAARCSALATPEVHQRLVDAIEARTTQPCWRPRPVITTPAMASRLGVFRPRPQ